MPLSINELVVLRKQLELDRKKLQERENAVRVVEEMLREGGAGPSGNDSTERVHRPKKTGRAVGFTEAVRDAVMHFGAETFIGSDIEALLRSQGKPVPKANPRSRISVIIKNMRDAGLVELRTKGKGSKPDRYRLRQQQEK